MKLVVATQRSVKTDIVDDENETKTKPLYEILQEYSCLRYAVASKDQELAKDFAAHQAVQDILDEWFNCTKKYM